MNVPPVLRYDDKMLAMSDRFASIFFGVICAMIAIGCWILDIRKCSREGYESKYGRRVCSIWMLPAAAFAGIAMILFETAFSK
jgi:hypothetical protein